MKKAILFSDVDREDGWVCGGMAFSVSSVTYPDAYNELKAKLESKEIVDLVIENRCLLSDLFNGDTSYRFTKTTFTYRLTYHFVNSVGDEVECKFSCDFIHVD